MICTICFMELSATGTCNCETPTLPEKVTTEDFSVSPTLSVDGRMSLDETMKYARKKMDHYGFESVKLKWMNSKTMYGQTRGNVLQIYEIRLSKPLFEHISLEQQIDTILHEIAHALTWGHGHDAVWRKVAVEIGCTGRVCSAMDKEVREKISKYTGICPNGHKQYRNARSAKMYIVSCGRCSPVYDTRFKYTWTQNF